MWQLVTSMFTHVEPLHLAANMIALWFLGPQLEAALGRLRFLALYLLSGLAGSAMILWFTGDQVQTVGASGAIFGLMGGLLVMAVKVGSNVSQIGMLLLVNLVITFTIPGISWQGHLGGFVGGVLVGAALVYAPRGPRRGAWQARASGRRRCRCGRARGPARRPRLTRPPAAEPGRALSTAVHEPVENYTHVVRTNHSAVVLHRLSPPGDSPAPRNGSARGLLQRDNLVAHDDRQRREQRQPHRGRRALARRSRTARAPCRRRA